MRSVAARSLKARRQGSARKKILRDPNPVGRGKYTPSRKFGGHERGLGRVWSSCRGPRRAAAGRRPRAGGRPAAVLADFLGIHVNTAVRWVTYARQDWAAYLTARNADLASSRDNPKEPGEQDAPA
jgi:hypothetical protein